MASARVHTFTHGANLTAKRTNAGRNVMSNAGAPFRVPQKSGGRLNSLRAKPSQYTHRLRVASDEIAVAEPLEEVTVPNINLPVAPTIDVEIQSEESGALTVIGRLDAITLSSDAVYQILTDHENSHEVFRTILDVERTEQPDGAIILEQNCKWSFLFFSGSFPVVLEVREDPASKSFTFRDTQAGGFMKRMEGSWNVQPSTENPGGVLVEHRLTIQMAVTAPPPFADYTNKIFFSQVSEILGDLSKAIVERY